MGIIPLTAAPAPPTRFRIWHAGNNPGDYGDNVLTAAAAARVLAEYQKRGHALAIDVQHATNPESNPGYDPADPPPMAGYAEIRVVRTAAGAEVWATDVRWSDCGRPHPEAGKVCCGKHQIASGQRRYISPDWNLDPETREPISINRLSLVAEPGTYGINMLAARAGAASRSSPMNDTEILKALLAAAMGAASSQDADIQAFGAIVSQQAADLAAAKGLSLDAAPASDATPVAAADPKVPAADPNVAAAPMAGIEEAVAAAVKKLGLTAGAKGVTSADVRAIVAEDAERRALIEANKDKLGAVAHLLASKPLTEVKAFVAAVASKSTSKDEPVRGAPVGGGIESSKTYSLADRFAAKGK
jgi:hypothetical protein